jgi:hypothetical protein
VAVRAAIDDFSRRMVAFAQSFAMRTLAAPTQASIYIEAKGQSMRAAVNFFSKKFKRMSISRYLAHQVLSQGNVARALTHRRLKYD